MADVKWVKITTDVFDDEKIMLIESLPSGDSIIVIWFKLIVFAGKQNNDGVFMMSNRIAYTEEMFATIFRRSIELIRTAFKVFEQFGMIEVVENVVCIPNWNKHQTLDAYEKKKERDKIYQQERRKKQKMLALGVESSEPSSDESSDSQTTPSSDVAVSDKEEDKEIDLDNINNIVEKESRQNTIKEIVEYLNLKTKKSFKASTKATQRHISARLEEGYSLEDFKCVIDKKVREWQGTEMDRYLRPETLFGTKFEGYLNQSDKPVPSRQKSNTNKFHNFEQREYDYEAMEQRFMNKIAGIPNGTGIGGLR